MPPRPFVNDALWRSNHLARAPAPTPAPVTLRTALRKHSKPRGRPQCQSRFYSAAASAASNTNTTFFEQPHIRPSAQQPQSQSSWLARNAKPRQQVPLTQLPTHMLYEDLRIEGGRGNFDQVMSICRVLVQDRGQAPDKDMYAAILHSFTSSDQGTAGKVRKVLEEMGFWSDASDMAAGQKVELDIRGCENVLEALSVHPDYLLRAEVLEYMRAKWFALSPRAQGFVVAGLLRDRCFEQALEMLEDMCGKVRVEDWVWSVAMWTLLEFGEVEEAFHVLGLKQRATERSAGGDVYGVKLSTALWGALLDAAANKQLHDAARIVWSYQVQPGFLKPATGTCVAVLSLAARHGDVQLATDVFRLLTERETIFTTHHYELLIATYLKANALSDALSVILIMTDANLKVDAGTCHPLYWYLRHTPPVPTITLDERGEQKEEKTPMYLHAFSLLQDFEAQGRRVPTAAVNCCIQAAVSLDAIRHALEIYKALHTVSPAGPNTETFNLLFRACAVAGRKDLAMFLANEMLALNLQPDRITYDRLMLVCERAGDLDDQFGYFEEMRAAGYRPRRNTYEGLIKALCDKGDERAVGVLKDFIESGAVVARRLETTVRTMFKAGVEGVEESREGDLMMS
ncbi:hypothetical protein G6514_009826 [Epicoccum nigrum]|nr:hypothetical protein G6514_009826 [Epicoccum nigrum]